MIDLSFMFGQVGCLVLGFFVGLIVGWILRAEYLLALADIKALQEAEDEAIEQNRGID